ncbi:MAG: ATP-binding protein [Candidatus Eisenbacteria bacterium]
MGHSSARAHRRRFRVSRRALLIGLFLLLLLLVLNASAFLTYIQVHGTIDEELGGRLLGIASATAAGISPADMRALKQDPAGETAGRLRAFLARVRLETEVGELYLFDESRLHLLDVDAQIAPGTENPSVELHYAAATAALAGVPAASELYEVGGVYLKTGFAPVLDEAGGVLGALAAEGGASFFQGLWRLRRQVLITGAAGMIAVLALAVFFTRLLRAQAVAERTLRETSALAAAGELAALLAHEIRNPLAVVSSRAERVRAKIEKGSPPEEILSWFEAIPSEVARLDRILTQYLSYARPADLDEEAAAPGATIDAVVGLLENDLGRKGIRLVRETGGLDAIRVRMAPAALHQVLLNLLLNARDAMPGGGVLTLTARRSRKSLLLGVADTGVGMSADQRRRVFDAFYTTKPHGSGLGLAVVRSMLDLYGARVEVSSAPGAGSAFVLDLPLAAEEGPPPAGREAHPPSKEVADG